MYPKRGSYRGLMCINHTWINFNPSQSLKKLPNEWGRNLNENGLMIVFQDDPYDCEHIVMIMSWPSDNLLIITSRIVSTPSRFLNKCHNPSNLKVMVVNKISCGHWRFKKFTIGSFWSTKLIGFRTLKINLFKLKINAFFEISLIM